MTDLIEEAREWTRDVEPPNGTHLVDRLADELETSRAQLQSSADEIGRLRAALEAVAAPSEYLVMHPEAQARINVARAALTTPATETKDG